MTGEGLDARSYFSRARGTRNSRVYRCFARAEGRVIEVLRRGMKEASRDGLVIGAVSGALTTGSLTALTYAGVRVSLEIAF